MHHIPEDKAIECFHIFAEWNKHISYKLGKIGWCEDDFLNQYVTVEILIDYSLTNIEVKKIDTSKYD